MPENSLLPLATSPWRTRIERRHQPAPPSASDRQGYRKFLPCLRWALALAEGDPELVDLARLLRSYLKRAWQDLERYLSIPRDAGNDCACRDQRELTLPLFLEEQTLALPADPR